MSAQFLEVEVNDSLENKNGWKLSIEQSEQKEVAKKTDREPNPKTNKKKNV